MSGPLVSASAAFVAKNSRIPPYAIEQSLRFDGGGSKLVLSSPSSSYTTNKFTMSCWVKMGPIASDFRMMSRDGAPNNVENVWCSFNAFGNNVIVSYMYTASINGRQVLNTLGTQRDPSAWYHIVFGFDSSTGNTQRIWVNGVEQTTGKDTISGVAGFAWSSTYPFVIGGGTSHGYVAEYHFIDNTWLNSPNDFGAFDDEGVWRPIEYTGSYGTNGFYLKFDPTAANGIGHDHSGTGNHLTATGFDTTNSTASTYDVMSDTPTTNWCTLNPLSFGPSNADMVEGNLRFNQPTSTIGNAKGTIAVSSGKWYWEVTPQTTATANVAGGILGAAETSTSFQPGNYATGYSYYSTGETRHNGVDATYGASYGAGDVIGTALDLDAGTLVFYKNGVSQGTAYSSVSGTFVPAIGDTSTGSSSALVCNFGQRAFAYTPPTGFKALNTKNLPAPTVKDGSDYFNTVLYTGNQTARDITVADNSGNAWQPDFVWLKSRAGTSVAHHGLFDAVRGANKGLYSSLNYAEAAFTQTLTSFNSDGFSLGTDADWGGSNWSSTTYVAWNWKEGATQGFDIITGTGGDAVNHNLGVAPDFVMFKYRNATSDWNVYHKDATSTSQRLKLNSTAAVESIAASWTINSTNFAYGGGSNTWVAYLFSEVESYSRIGSYVGNGSSDGPFVYCGFRPAFVLAKDTTAHNWEIIDNARDTYNVANKRLFPSNSSAESSSVNTFDFLSNGFKVRGTHGGNNTSGNTHIFIAFAEHPFGGSGVNPATAR